MLDRTREKKMWKANVEFVHADMVNKCIKKKYPVVSLTIYDG